MIRGSGLHGNKGAEVIVEKYDLALGSVRPSCATANQILYSVFHGASRALGSLVHVVYR